MIKFTVKQVRCNLTRSVTNVGKSTSYNSDIELTVKDRYVTVIETGVVPITKSIALSSSPVDGQTENKGSSVKKLIKK